MNCSPGMTLCRTCIGAEIDICECVVCMLHILKSKFKKEEFFTFLGKVVSEIDESEKFLIHGEWGVEWSCGGGWLMVLRACNLCMVSIGLEIRTRK